SFSQLARLAARARLREASRLALRARREWFRIPASHATLAHFPSSLGWLLAHGCGKHRVSRSALAANGSESLPPSHPRSLFPARSGVSSARLSRLPLLVDVSEPERTQLALARAGVQRGDDHRSQERRGDGRLVSSSSEIRRPLVAGGSSGRIAPDPSKHVFHAQLHLSGGAGDAVENPSERRARHRRRRETEAWVVQHVRRVDAYFEILTADDVGSLRQRNVEVRE